MEIIKPKSLEKFNKIFIHNIILVMTINRGQSNAKWKIIPRIGRT